MKYLLPAAGDSEVLGMGEWEVVTVGGDVEVTGVDEESVALELEVDDCPSATQNTQTIKANPAATRLFGIAMVELVDEARRKHL